MVVVFGLYRSSGDGRGGRSSCRGYDRIGQFRGCRHAVVSRICYRRTLRRVRARVHAGAGEYRVVAGPFYPPAFLFQAICIGVNAIETLILRRARYSET